MTTWEQPVRERHQERRKTTPSFSSSLLDAICHSIDESQGKEDQTQQKSFGIHRRNNALEVEEEIASLRRAILVEKWMESYKRSAQTSRHFNSDSSSSTDSTSLFSSSETESASKSSPKSSVFHVPKLAQTHEATPIHEGSFVRTKSSALKIYGDLKKVKQPISPGGKIANFLNSIFNSKNMKKHQGASEDWNSVKKSRSVKGSSITCLNRAQPFSTSRAKSNPNSKRSVRFCPVSVIVDEDCQPCGQKSIYDKDPILRPTPKISSQFIKTNMNSFRNYEEKGSNRYKFRSFYEDGSDDEEEDDRKSCTSSDLFDLENIGIVGVGANREELPVYGTTNLKINQAIANGLIY